MSNHRLFFFIISLGGIFLYGCSDITPTPLPSQIDKSLFTGVPCEAPCWYGLEIGKSNEDDVLVTLATLSFLKQDTININPVTSMPSIDSSIWSDGVRITADCTYPQKHCITVNVVDDILTKIEVELNYDIDVNEVVENLGKPDYIGYGMLGGERIICEVYLVYQDKRTVLVSQKFEGHKTVEKYCGTIRDTGKVMSTLVVPRIRYMSSQELVEFLMSWSNEMFEFTGTYSDE